MSPREIVLERNIAVGRHGIENVEGVLRIISYCCAATLNEADRGATVCSVCTRKFARILVDKDEKNWWLPRCGLEISKYGEPHTPEHVAAWVKAWTGLDVEVEIKR